MLRWREASILLAGVLLAAYFQSTNSAFLSLSNIENLIDYTATTSIIAAGEVMVLVCGELDLSVGMVYALSPFIMHFAIAAGLPAGAAVILALAAAGLVGLVNGAITTLLSVPAFVTTLGHDVSDQWPDLDDLRRLSGRASSWRLSSPPFSAATRGRGSPGRWRSQSSCSSSSNALASGCTPLRRAAISLPRQKSGSG